MSAKNKIIIAVDFDGTIVTHQFPRIGTLVPYAKKVLTKLSTIPEVQLMLWTMRSTLGIKYDNDSTPTDTLQEAFTFLKRENLNFSLDWINFNPEQSWSHSNKQYANIYIDDAALGCPLMESSDSERPVVDWFRIENLLENHFLNPLLSVLYSKTKCSTSQLSSVLEYGNAYALGTTDSQDSFQAFYIPEKKSAIIPMQKFYSDLGMNFPIAGFYFSHPATRGNVIIICNGQLISSIPPELGIILKHNEISDKVFSNLFSLEWTVYELPTRFKQILNAL